LLSGLEITGPSAAADAGTDASDAGSDVKTDATDASDASDAKADSTSDASDAGPDASDASDAEAGSEGSAPDSGGPSCVFDAGAAPAPDAAPACGNGYVEMPSEQCDDGLGSAPGPRACSSTCQVLDELVGPPGLPDGGVPGFARTLGRGRHPTAASLSTFAVAYTEAERPPVALSLASFTAKGLPTGVVHGFNGTSVVLADSNPVIAALPCDSYLAAWTDYGGDGDERGVAMRVVTPGQAPSGPLMFANTTTSFSQFDPDVIVAGGQVVVAWVDDSNAATQLDIRFNTFDPTTLQPQGGEQTLAGTSDTEADVSLASFAGSWAAAWRDDDANGLETIRVHTGSTDWTVGPSFLPGPAGSKPALAQLDATHLLVAYAVGTAPSVPDAGAGDAGADGGEAGATLPPASPSKVQWAVLAMAAPGNVTGVDVVPSVTSAFGLSQNQPNLMPAGANVYLAWHTDANPGDPNGEEVWLKPLTWNAGVLSTAAAEAPLPRTAAHRLGDQRSVGFAVSSLPPAGALVSAWDDLGKTLGTGEGTGDIGVQLLPAVPVPPGICMKQSAANLITNGGFDTNVNGWLTFDPQIVLTESTQDATQCTTSGSVLASNTAANGLNSGFYECVPVVAGQSYNAGTWLLTPSGGAQGQTFLHVSFTSGANCTASIVQDVLLYPTGNFDAWELLSQDNIVAPAGAVAAELYGAIIKNFPNTLPYQTYFDDMYLTPTPGHF
jgi:hypothetical protein